MEKSTEIKELAIALCKFQGAVETIKKTETNPFFKSKYASLADILNVIREPLTDNGISFVQFPKGKYGLETMLLHVSGEWLSESFEMEPTKKDPQGAGSVITYQRRYALGAILGLNIDIDDDANKASEEEKITTAMVMRADELIRTSTLPEEKKLSAEKALSDINLTMAEYTAIVNVLKQNQPKKY
jgi:hypothetical protein